MTATVLAAWHGVRVNSAAIAIASCFVYTTRVCGELIRLQIRCVKFKTGFLRNAIKCKVC